VNGAGNARRKAHVYVPYWTNLPDANHGCTLLLHYMRLVASKVNAIELEFTVGHCAGVKEAV
jgi:hypothetical protein